VGTPYYLSGSDALVSDKAKVQQGSAQMLETAAPTSQGGGAIVLQDGSDPQGTSVSFTTPVLDRPLDLAGIPSVTFRVSAPTFQSDPAAARLILFAKLYDVAPDGTVDLVHRLVSSVRVADTSQPVTLTLPGIVHEFAAGHRIELVLAATDAAYKNSLAVQPVTVLTSSSSPSVVTLPVLGIAQARAALRPSAAGRAATGTTAGSALPATGMSELAPLLGVIATAMGMVSFALRRRLPAIRAH
jgi:predicted acyl esterase